MPINPSSTRVLVTGAGSFVGLHTLLQLLQLGYKVRGTVRTESHADHVKEVLAKQTVTENLELVLADLTKDEGWHEAVRDCDFVLHVASPYPAENPKDEDDLFIPARNGTLRVLRAAQDEKVKRVVLVSSIAAVIGGHIGENRTFDHTDWTDIGKTGNTYTKSKTMAERAAWDFMNSAENKNHLEMVSVNPSNVFGPVLDDHFHTSVEWFRTLMKAEVPGVSGTKIDFVDVRDVVDALISSMTLPEASGGRFIVNGVSIPLLEFANILHDNFASLGYRVPNRLIPNLVVRIFALFTPKLKSVADSLGWQYNISTEHTQATLHWQPRPYEQTVVEMGKSLIEHGMI